MIAPDADPRSMALSLLVGGEEVRRIGVLLFSDQEPPDLLISLCLPVLIKLLAEE
jgi:hypothetical protein